MCGRDWSSDVCSSDLAQAEKAYNSGALITSNDDNAFIATSSDNRNPLETITDWGEF